MDKCKHNIKALMTTIDFLFDSLRDDVVSENPCLPEERDALLRVALDWQIQLKRCLAKALIVVHRFERSRGENLFLIGKHNFVCYC